MVLQVRILCRMPAKIISKLIVPNTTPVALSTFFTNGIVEAHDLILQPLIQTGVLRVAEKNATLADGLPVGAIGANFQFPDFMSMRGKEPWDLTQIFVYSSIATDSMYVLLSVRADRVI